jgi:hypothetical protein
MSALTRVALVRASAVVYHELNASRYGRAYNRLIHYHKGRSSSLYRRRSILFISFLIFSPSLFDSSSLEFSETRRRGARHERMSSRDRSLGGLGLGKNPNIGVDERDQVELVS